MRLTTSRMRLLKIVSQYPIYGIQFSYAFIDNRILNTAIKANYKLIHVTMITGVVTVGYIKSLG